jgi:hypothetical protein
MSPLGKEETGYVSLVIEIISFIPEILGFDSPDQHNEDAYLTETIMDFQAFIDLPIQICKCMLTLQ